MSIGSNRSARVVLFIAALALSRTGPARAGDATPGASASCTLCHGQTPSHAPPTNVQGGLDDNTQKHVESYLNLKRTAPEWQLQALAANPHYTVYYPTRDTADAILGVTLVAVDDAVRAQLDLPERTGLRVAVLEQDGAAARVGLKVNDILLALGEAPLSQPGDLTKRLKANGEKDVPLKLLRGGKPVTITVRPVSQTTFGPAQPEKVDYYIGVSTALPDEFLKAHVTIPGYHGLLVTAVVPDSPADKAGVKKHDLLVKINDHVLDRPETLAAQVQAAADKAATLVLLRSGKPLTLAVKPEPRKATAAGGQASAAWIRDVTGAVYGLDWGNVTWAQPNLDYTLTSPFTASPPPTALSANPTNKRLDDLDKELKALRQAVEEVRDALKKGK